ncbi:LysR substrate-binding domain-containing protein [Consotaella salsifontis]|uniref:DNA-binding transcriptional regulator, LysR family n=1 Tax=Consotaella salsifontis TaxID=1365950 RepID=A0A1T4L161_9HYPH|nr:LysR substrate-binding domain-containing protein [Consotaella salsifontis]SJZ48439.1 DNA-binding transcriptional regulator, LysR family [Consotaella salsifontis]
MTLEQLRIFLAVAEAEHVTRAAGALGLTQSAVSAAVAALEARHDVKLFHRVGRGIELTEAGRAFVPQARAVLARVDTATEVLAELGGRVVGQLRLAASQTVASYWLPQRLVRLHEIYPELDIRLIVTNTAHAAEMLVEGTVDLAVVEGNVDAPALEAQVVDRDRLMLVVGPGHPWATRGDIVIDELGRTGWILREEGSGTRAAFEHWLGACGLPLAGLNVVLELPSNEAVLAAVEACAAATVLSERAARLAVRSGLVVPLRMDLPERLFSVISHRERYRTRAASALIELLHSGG